MKQKRILIADPHPSMLTGVRVLIKDHFMVIFMAADERSLMTISSVRVTLRYLRKAKGICATGKPTDAKAA
jgi:hypothetical protein